MSIAIDIEEAIEDPSSLQAEVEAMVAVVRRPRPDGSTAWCLSGDLTDPLLPIGYLIQFTKNAVQFTYTARLSQSCFAIFVDDCLKLYSAAYCHEDYIPNLPSIEIDGITNYAVLTKSGTYPAGGKQAAGLAIAEWMTEHSQPPCEF